MKIRYAHTYIRGIDINPDLAKVSKMHMILYDDGHTGIFEANSLDPFEKINELALKARAGEIKRESFDIVMTNPPFGTKGKVTDKYIRDGDHYVLNGTKQWITNGGEAEMYTVIALTNPAKGPRGASALIVERGTPGFSFGKKEDKLGIRASATRELIFQDCRVPAQNLIGREGTGFITTMRTFDASRPGVGAQALGIAQGALDLAVEYACNRRQFGAPVSSFQGLRFMLADMAMKIEAARALVYATARYIDSSPQQRPTKYAAMCKCFAADVAMEVTTDAVQVFGGYGYMRDYPIEKYMRDAKITQIYEGTNQIQREVIALQLIKESLHKKE